MPELQQPDIVGNFLSSYYTAQQKQQADADRQRNMMRQDRADSMAEQQFKWNIDDRQLQAAREQQDKFARLAQWADTPQKWAQATAMAEAEGIQGASKVPFEQRDAKLASMLDVKTQLDQEWKRREFALRQREVNSTIEARNRTGAGGAKAPAGYMWSPDGSSLVAIPGGPSDPTKKLTEVQSKDLAYYQRGSAALAKLDDDRAAAMSSTWNSTFGEAPFGLGNVLQTQSSRQGKQAAAEFLAAILRKDSGAALTKSDFDIYGTIFMPQMGDDPDTLAQKAASRRQALESLRAGLGSAQILADAGAPVTTPPPAGEAGPAAEVPPPPPGARIMK